VPIPLGCTEIGRRLQASAGGCALLAAALWRCCRSVSHRDGYTALLGCRLLQVGVFVACMVRQLGGMRSFDACSRSYMPLNAPVAPGVLWRGVCSVEWVQGTLKAASEEEAKSLQAVLFRPRPLSKATSVSTLRSCSALRPPSVCLFPSTWPGDCQAHVRAAQVLVSVRCWHCLTHESFTCPQVGMPC